MATNATELQDGMTKPQVNGQDNCEAVATPEEQRRRRGKKEPQHTVSAVQTTVESEMVPQPPLNRRNSPRLLPHVVEGEPPLAEIRNRTKANPCSKNVN